MKIVENSPFKSTLENDDRPFWHKFPVAICDVVGIDPTKQDVQKIEITVEAGKMPVIVVTMQAYSEGQLKPIVDVLKAAEWHKPEGIKRC